MVELLVGAAAGVAAASRIPGPLACSASLKPGVGYETCDLDEATVVIVTEEGVGRCHYYPYTCKELADTHFTSMKFVCYARIMYSWCNGAFVSELKEGGLHRLPMKTIRRAAMKFNLSGKVFVQADTLGFASYHFIDMRTAYISYTSELCAAWRLDNGTPLPREKHFEKVLYSRTNRRFSGLVDWSPTSFCGDQRFEFDLVFDEDFQVIIGGEVRHYTPGISDRDSDQQVLYYRAATQSDHDAAPNVLRYTRWHSGESPSASPASSMHSPSTSMHHESVSIERSPSPGNSFAISPLPGNFFEPSSIDETSVSHPPLSGDFQVSEAYF